MRKSKAFVSLVIATVAVGSSKGQIPGIISHQGKITVNGTNFTGNGQFKFALVDAAGTNTYWSHDGSSTGGSAPSSAVTLSATRGVFSAYLGDTNVSNMTQPISGNVFTNSEVYLRTWFNDGTDGFQQLTPDERLSSAPYALAAGYYAEKDPVFSASVASTLTTNRVTGWDQAVSWGNHSTNGYLTQTAGDARYLKNFTESDPVFGASAANGIQSSDIANWNGKIGGTGSANYVPMFTGGTTLANSPIFADGLGKVGIGTVTPSQKLEVNGTVKSSTGGFMFPDGTVQTTAASGGGGASTVLVQAYLSSDVSLTQNALTQLPFGNTAINVGGALSSGSFTVPAAGNYVVQCAAVSGNSAGHTKMVVIYNNGSLFYSGSVASGIGSIPSITSGYVASAIYTGPLHAGDVLTFYVGVNSAGISVVSGASTAKTSLVITKLP